MHRLVSGGVATPCGEAHRLAPSLQHPAGRLRVPSVRVHNTHPVPKPQCFSNHFFQFHRNDPRGKQKTRVTYLKNSWWPAWLSGWRPAERRPGTCALGPPPAGSWRAPSADCAQGGFWSVRVWIPELPASGRRLVWQGCSLRRGRTHMRSQPLALQGFPPGGPSPQIQRGAWPAVGHLSPARTAPRQLAAP